MSCMSRYLMKLMSWRQGVESMLNLLGMNLTRRPVRLDVGVDDVDAVEELHQSE